MRSRIRYNPDNVSEFKTQLQHWAQQFNVFSWLDSNDHKDPYSSFDALLAVGAETCCNLDIKGAFRAFSEYRSETKDWLFGYLGYDLKNDIEPLSSEGKNELDFPALYFFQPQKIIRIKGKTAEFLYLRKLENEVAADIAQIQQSHIGKSLQADAELPIELSISKEDYHSQVEEILKHIHRGDIYEMNFCQEFYSREALIDPLLVYKSLNQISLPPFASFMRLGEQFVLSASPERFLKKRATKIISQPIKGTARRSDDPDIDRQLKQILASDPKERAENIMITDLVRNDLSRYALKGSVLVKELCKVYTYKQVHQLVSTIEADISNEADPVNIIQAAFPMGSMTGAPKISAMELIEKYERTMRGVYSGALGYFTPDGDFDLSVVIRSILYNRDKKYLSFSVGSAITALAKPDKEYQECHVKAKAMRHVLEPSAKDHIFEQSV